MEIIVNDSRKKLDVEIRKLFRKAFIVACEKEFCIDKDFDINDIEKLPLQLDVSIFSNEEIKKLNSDFRGIDKKTDVLSFPQFNNSGEIMDEIINHSDIKNFRILIGDVVICYEKAVEQAIEYETGLKREIVYLFVHSIFHLFGYDHIVDADKKIMREKEEKVMKELSI